MNTAVPISEIADRFFTAIETGDIDLVAEIYAPDAVIWHNTDQREQSVAQNLRVLGWMVMHITDRRYDDVRRTVLADGFVQQHTLRGTGPNGPVAVPAMLRVWMRDGTIVRLDEYLDSAHVADLV